MLGLDLSRLSDPEAEQSLVGALLLAPERLPEAAAELESRDWSRETNRQIWEAIAAVAGRGVEVDLITVGNELESRGVLQAVGGRAQLSWLEDQVVTTRGVRWWARQIHCLAERRREVEALLQQAQARLREPLPVEAQGPPPWVLMEEVEQEPVAWLWRQRLPLGKVVVLDGDPGLGKSVLTVDLAARVSAGREMPDGSPGLGAPAGVVICAAEDGLADTVRPRLQAAGGDLSRVLGLVTIGSGEQERDLQLPQDLSVLERAIQAVEARLVVIDPLTAFLDPELSANRDQDVRRVLRRLQRLAQRCNCCILVIRHLNKVMGLSALYRGSGSVGIVGVARVGLVVARDPEDRDRRVLAVTKSNLSQEAQALAFRVGRCYDPAGNVEGIARLEWLGPAQVSADELVGALGSGDGSSGRLRDEVKEYLLGLLAEGPKSATECIEALKEATGASVRTIKSVKKELQIESHPQGHGQGRWVWSLPTVQGCEEGKSASRVSLGSNPPLNRDTDPLTPLHPSCPHCGGQAAPARPDGWWCPSCLQRWGQQEEES
jgi:hypothetical protein